MNFILKIPHFFYLRIREKTQAVVAFQRVQICIDMMNLYSENKLQELEDEVRWIHCLKPINQVRN